MKLLFLTCQFLKLRLSLRGIGLLACLFGFEQVFHLGTLQIPHLFFRLFQLFDKPGELFFLAVLNVVRKLLNFFEGLLLPLTCRIGLILGDLLRSLIHLSGSALLATIFACFLKTCCINRILLGHPVRHFAKSLL